MRKRACAILSGVALAAGAAQGSVLYSVGPFESGVETNLYSIETSTGAATLIGPTGETQIGGLATASDGSLYGYNAGLLFKIDPFTGHSTRIGELGQICPEGGLAIHPATGILYGVRSLTPGDELIRIDMATGAATTIGLLGEAGAEVSGLAFDPAGTLWGLSLKAGYPDQLVTIDLTTGAAAAAGTLGVIGPGPSLPSVGGLEYDAATGLLYATDGETLYSIDPATAQIARIGDHGLGNLAGLAAVVPEPTSVIGLALSAGMLLMRRRRAF